MYAIKLSYELSGDKKGLIKKVITMPNPEIVSHHIHNDELNTDEWVIYHVLMKEKINP